MKLSEQKPGRERVPIGQLVFLPELQMRQFPGGATTDPAWVKHLRELRADGAVFEPIETVTDGRVYWVHHGHHRGAAYLADGDETVECLVRFGTLTDARYLALRANERAVLPRRPEDCQKAFATLMGDDELRGRAVEDGKENGGIHRALARACGLSRGVVSKYLELAGWKATRDGQLVRVTPAASPPPTPPAPPPPAPAPAPARLVDPAVPDGDVYAAEAADLDELARAVRPTGPNDPLAKNLAAAGFDLDRLGHLLALLGTTAEKGIVTPGQAKEIAGGAA